MNIFSFRSKKYITCADIHLPQSQYRPLSFNNNNNNNNNNFVKHVSIVHISDTHCKHLHMNNNIPSGDILIHTGDFLHKCSSINNDGSLPQQLINFNKWIGRLPHKIKIVICGNHDGILQHMKEKKILSILSNVTYYLQDSSINIYGINIYGIPWTLNHSKNTGFGINLYAKYVLNEKIDLIPNNTDILLSHSPPYNILDLAYKDYYNNKTKCNKCNFLHQHYKHWGSKYLLKSIFQRIKPKAHLFGHVHDSSGSIIKNGILFCNSSMALDYKYCHKFNVVFDLKDTIKHIGSPNYKLKNKFGINVSNNNIFLLLINGYIRINHTNIPNNSIIIPNVLIKLCFNYYLTPCNWSQSKDGNHKPFPQLIGYNVRYDDIKIISVNIVYSFKQLMKIRAGSIPETMEDKWFIFEDNNNILNICRSWTGETVYQCSLKQLKYNNYNNKNDIILHIKKLKINNQWNKKYFNKYTAKNLFMILLDVICDINKPINISSNKWKQIQATTL